MPTLIVADAPLLIRRPRLRAVARRVAVELVERAADAASRWTRPRSEPTIDTPAREIVLHPEPEPPPPPPPPPLSWQLAQHVGAQLDARVRALCDAPLWNPDTHAAAGVRARRVASRRLRACLDLHRSLVPAPLAKGLRRDLRRIGRALGPVREWDVLCTQIADLSQGGDVGQRAALEHVLEHAENKREQAQRSADGALRRLDAAELRTRLRDASDRIVGAWAGAGTDAADEAWRLLRARTEAAFAACPPVRSAVDDGPVHEVRIQMKRLRYSLEYLQPALGADYKAVRRPLRRAQRIIGNARDLGQLHSYLSKRYAKLVARRRPTLAAGLESVIAEVAAERDSAVAEIPRVLQLLDRSAVLDQARGALAGPAGASPNKAGAR